MSMNILSIQNLAKMGREAPLFAGVTFGMDAGDKAAVIGRNGTGKSTLLAVIAGALTADDGTVVLNKGAGVSYLAQNPAFNASDTIREHIFASVATSPKLRTIREYEEACDALAVLCDDDVIAPFKRRILTFLQRHGVKIRVVDDTFIRIVPAFVMNVRFSFYLVVRFHIFYCDVHYIPP